MAKYWVLTNLLPGPIPQVSVYGIPTSRTDNGGKVVTQVIKQNKMICCVSFNFINELRFQEGMLSQHASLLPADSLLLQQHSQIPVSISTSQGVANLAIPTDALHIESNQQQNHAQMSGNNQSQNDQNQQQINQINSNNQQTNMVQVQVGCKFVYQRTMSNLRAFCF